MSHSLKIVDQCFLFGDVKQVTLHELLTGAPLCRTEPISTQATLRLLVSSNYRHLITISTPILADSSGLIHVWQLPDLIVGAIRSNQDTLQPTSPPKVAHLEVPKEVPRSTSAQEEESITED